MPPPLFGSIGLAQNEASSNEIGAPSSASAQRHELDCDTTTAFRYEDGHVSFTFSTAAMPIGVTSCKPAAAQASRARASEFASMAATR